MSPANLALDRLVDDAMLVSETRYVCARVEHSEPSTWAVTLYDRDPVSAGLLGCRLTPLAIGTGGSLLEAVSAAQSTLDNSG